MSYKIEPRDGIEVIPTKENTIIISQDRFGVDGSMVIVREDQVDELIEYLKSAKNDLQNMYFSSDSEDEESSDESDEEDIED